MNAIPRSLHLRPGLVAAAALGLPAAAAHAQLPQTVVLTTTVDGQQEVPPNGQPGTGTGTIVVDTVNNTAEIDIDFADVPTANAAHIHGPADPGQSAGILFPFTSAASPLTGTWTYTEADEAAIVGGRIYVNIHSPAFSAGEIRGQLVNATSYCWGDGSATACPCANASIVGRGCANSTSQGALLLVTGNNAAVGNDNQFWAHNLLPDEPAMLFMGVDTIDTGNGATFGDGLRCAGGGVVRLGIELPDAAGRAVWTPALGESPATTRRFQVWYPDAAGGPCGDGFNLSNGLEITFH